LLICWPITNLNNGVIRSSLNSIQFHLNGNYGEVLCIHEDIFQFVSNMIALGVHFYMSKALVSLDLYHNFTGCIPSSLGKLSNLSFL